MTLPLVTSIYITFYLTRFTAKSSGKVVNVLNTAVHQAMDIQKLYKLKHKSLYINKTPTLPLPAAKSYVMIDFSL